MYFHSITEKVGWCWIWFRLISGKPSLLSFSQWRHEQTLAKHFKALGGEQSLTESLVSFWLIPCAEEFLARKWQFAQICSARTTPKHRLRQTVWSHFPKFLQLHHQTKDEVFLLFRHIQRHDQQLYDGCEKVFDLLIFSHILAHIKGWKLFKKGGEYGIFSLYELIQARRKQERGLMAWRRNVACGIARHQVLWSLFTPARLQRLLWRIYHCTLLQPLLFLTLRVCLCWFLHIRSFN